MTLVGPGAASRAARRRCSSRSWSSRRSSPRRRRRPHLRGGVTWPSRRSRSRRSRDRPLTRRTRSSRGAHRDWSFVWQAVTGVGRPGPRDAPHGREPLRRARGAARLRPGRRVPLEPVHRRARGRVPRHRHVARAARRCGRCCSTSGSAPRRRRWVTRVLAVVGVVTVGYGLWLTSVIVGADLIRADRRPREEPAWRSRPGPRRTALRVVVIGAGAVGSFLGGMLAAAGHEVTLLTRRPHDGDDADRLRARGSGRRAHGRRRSAGRTTPRRSRTRTSSSSP